jgi:diacylglycerol kinase (ATP)
MSSPPRHAFLLLANPHAGRGLAVQRVHEASRALRAAGARSQAEVTESIEHATELAAGAAADGRVAVAVGGDGLARAVAAGAAQHDGGSGLVGLIPAGRGNDFARAVGLPTDLRGAVQVLLDGNARRTDCIAVTPSPGPDAAATATPQVEAPRTALGNVYLGFDSLSNVAANRQPIHLGRYSYSAAALRVALTMPALAFSLVVDGEPVDFVGSGVAIASSAYYGGAVQVAPGADPHDGLLDLVLFEQTTRRDRVATLLALRKGEHVTRPGVRTLQASRIDVRVDPPLEAYADGDPIATAPFTAEVRPGAIRLLRP